MKNPTTKFVKWKSSKGFYYYDKDKKEEVSIDKMYFIPIEEYATISGFHTLSRSGLWSNEISKFDSKKEPFKVYAGKASDDGKPAVIANGLYQDILGKLNGGKWTKSIYGALITGSKGNSELELINVAVSGGGQKPFTNDALKCEGNILELSKDPTVVNGSLGDYSIPKVVIMDKNESLMDGARALKATLAEYMVQYLDNKDEEMTSDIKPTEQPNKAVDVDDDLPF